MLVLATEVIFAFSSLQFNCLSNFQIVSCPTAIPHSMVCTHPGGKNIFQHKMIVPDRNLHL